MNFQTAIRTCLSKFATFTGRATRPEYWWFVLFVVLVQIVAGFLDGMFFPVEMVAVEGSDVMMPTRWIEPFGAIASLGLILPVLAAGARRLHDIGKSGWWLLLTLIPLIGSLVLLWFLTRPSNNDNNPFA